MTYPQILQLNCSIVGRVLDSILDQKTYSVGSRHGKKQKKSAKHLDPEKFNDATQSRDNMLALLGALLDVLLMKKDIYNRYAAHTLCKSKFWYSYY